MAWNFRTLTTSFLCFQLAIPSASLLAQQSLFQRSFLSPAAAHVSNIGEGEDVDDTYHLPYINLVAQESKLGPALFRPNASDLLIQQAEEKYRQGKQLLQSGDLIRARSEFDSAIDLMFRASDNPTNRQIFETKFEEMVESIHHLDLSGMGAAQAVPGPRFDKAPLEDIVQMTFPVDPKIKDKVKSEMATTTSALPLVVNDTVLGYINYFSGRGRRTIESGLERAGRYRPMISRIFAEEGVPQELIHLAQAESGFLPRAVSSAAAMGMWQFVKFRGNQYGLMQTPYSDDRLDPEKATRAAARHLRDLYSEFNDWYLAIAAYNCGPGTIERAVERTGYADFWELRARRVLPAETTNYVPIILAMTIMAKNAGEYGLDHLNPESPVEYDTVEINAPTHLALISDVTEAPLTQLQQLNPALFRSVAPSGYLLRVPKGNGTLVSSSLEMVPAERRASWRLHRIAPGEDIASIARRYSASPKALLSANNLSESAIPVAGDRLVIPAAGGREEVFGIKRVPSKRGSSQVAASKRNSSSRSATVARRSGSSRVKPTIAAAGLKKPLHRTAGTLAQVGRTHAVTR